MHDWGTMTEAVITIPRQAGISVRRARERQGLTRAQLARASGVSERTLASLELGDATGMRLDKLLASLSALGLELVVRDGSAPVDEVRTSDATPPQGQAVPSPTCIAPSAVGNDGSPSPEARNVGVPSLENHLTLLREVTDEQLRRTLR